MMDAPLPLRFRGKTELRLALIVLVTAVVPLVTAIVFARSFFERSVGVWLAPEIGHQLDRGLDVYKDYVRGQDPYLGRGFAQFQVCTAPTSDRPATAVSGNTLSINCPTANSIVSFGPDISRQTNALKVKSWGGLFQLRYKHENHDLKIFAEYANTNTFNAVTTTSTRSPTSRPATPSASVMATRSRRSCPRTLRRPSATCRSPSASRTPGASARS